MNHHHSFADYGTSSVGFLCALADQGQTIVTAIGLIVGVGSLACALSREVRAWLDRAAARKGAGS